MPKEKFVNVRVDYNARTHFEVLSSQFCESESTLLNNSAKKYLNPEYYESKGLFNRKNRG